jgi:hypothetical protein
MAKLRKEKRKSLKPKKNFSNLWAWKTAAALRISIPI